MDQLGSLARTNWLSYWVSTGWREFHTEDEREPTGINTGHWLQELIVVTLHGHGIR
jgi:hypothetical protein